MQIYTSYFANLKTLEEADIVPVAMCLKVPSFFKGPNIQSIAPSASILFEHKNNPDDERYKERYFNEILCAYRFHPEYLINTLESISEGKDIALLCYEKPGDFCHRHLFAEYFNNLMPELNIHEYPVYPKQNDATKTKKKKEDSLPKSFELF